MGQVIAERDALALKVREKIEKAAGLMEGAGPLPERLADAWWQLRPLFPTAVPGQAGLTEEQRRGLQGILDILGDGRGAGASGAAVRALDHQKQERVAIGLRRLAMALREGGASVRGGGGGQ